MPKGELIERRFANDFDEVKAFFSQLPKPATGGGWLTRWSRQDMSVSARPVR